MSISLKTPTQEEFQQVCEYIHEFELDNRELHKDQFTVAFRNHQIVGFGRIRNHSDCAELCSLGVVTQHRKQGIGKKIVTELINKNSLNLHLVCIIPKYFIPFGFITVDDYPSSIKNKLDYCTQALVVPETYLAMKLI